MDCSGGFNVITRILIRGRREGQRPRGEVTMEAERREDTMLLALKMDKRPGSKEYRWL